MPNNSCPLASCLLTGVIARSLRLAAQYLADLKTNGRRVYPLSEHGSPRSESFVSRNRTGQLARIAPGLSALLSYRFSDDFRHDAIAGLSVAAVALPVSIAYAQLAGFDPVVGLYSSILPLIAYAIFGSSRQLMVNPDAAACAMIAAAIAPLAGNARRFIFRSRLH